jgi:hypothetical protein
MKRAKWTTGQIEKQFKLEIPVFECHKSLHSLIRMMEFDGCDRLLDNESIEVADRMMGTSGWQGMLNEYRTFSGLKTRINKKMKLGWKVTERSLGDGFSVYYLG